MNTAFSNQLCQRVPGDSRSRGMLNGGSQARRMAVGLTRSACPKPVAERRSALSPVRANPETSTSAVATHVCRCQRQGFSLIEILVVVALLSIIILGLLMMFNQTQKAFRTGLAQVDVLESGRAATEMLARELAQMTPAHAPRSNRVNYGVNFYAGVPNMAGYVPLRQPLPGSATPAVERLNLLQELFFLSRYNRTWAGIGYLVTPRDDGVAALYRYYGTNSGTNSQDPGLLYNTFLSTPLTNMSRIVDGVVHFKIRAFDTNGVWINSDHPRPAVTNILAQPFAFGEARDLRFYSNAVPAFVEFELGVLENRVLERARSIPVAARRAYLEKQASRVHLFRMRVPIRNVDPTAYQP
ncbi:MAG: prepilin-type N-terminal cleavage/methylation domain-containing protein [Verrucomicrobiae bacterium]|nr:prepilin-type N-terminal cleavage/methylation domain-containing protein [Verrucomicrobiae bacterium]